MRRSEQQENSGTGSGKALRSLSSTKTAPRRRMAVVGVFLLVVLAAATSIIVMWKNEVARKEYETELSGREAALQVTLDERTFQFAQAERMVDELVWEFGYRDMPLTPLALSVLQNGNNFFARFVERDSEDPQLILARAKAFQKLGEINDWLGLPARAEAGYRESRHLLQNQGRESRDPSVRMMLAATNNSLACFLATAGRPEEAEGPASEAVAELENLLAADPRNSPVLSLLSYASRNLGLILACLGRNGVDEVQRSLAYTRELAHHVPGEITVAECLVDTHQILAQLLWRKGEVSQAEEACRRSIEEIDKLLATFRAIAADDGRTVSTLKYRNAAAMARANLALVSQSPEKDSPLSDGWLWSPLHQRPGWLLQPDLLVHGSLPGEFERQDAFLMAWLDEEWGKDTFPKIASEICRQAKLVIMVEDELVEDYARGALQTEGIPTERVRFCHVPTNSMWVRDYGPIVIDTGYGTFQHVALRTAFNYRNLRLEDSHAPMALSRLFGTPVVPTPCFLAGGELLSNGQGLCLVSTHVLEKNGRVGYSESQVTATIKRLFGAKQVVYLEPLKGEPTGHVDWFATFTSADTVVVGDYQGRDPVNSHLLDQHAERLAGVATEAGRLKVVRVPMPPRATRYFGGTYTNVIFANGVLLVPSCPEAPPELEREAFDVFRRLLPDWRIVGIDCSEFLARSGSLHCATSNLYRWRPSRKLESLATSRP